MSNWILIHEGKGSLGNGLVFENHNSVNLFTKVPQLGLTLNKEMRIHIHFWHLEPNVLGGFVLPVNTSTEKSTTKEKKHT